MMAFASSLAPFAPQFGWPSVASRRNLGLGSVSVFMYVTPVLTARRVGVRPDGPVAAMAAAMAVALFGAGAIAPVVFTVQLLLPPLFPVGKNVMPQLTVVWVFITTLFSAVVIDGHLHIAPVQPIWSW